MTIPGWGRLTPSQMYMLMLAGHALRRGYVPQGTVEADEERLKAMALGKCGSPADAAAAPGDEGHLASQVDRAHSSRRSRHGIFGSPACSKSRS
jgi:hypothetical protein